MTSADATVAVLGLGTMGGKAAARLAGAGARCFGYDPVPAAREAVVDHGVGVVGSISEAVAEADVVVLSLPMPADVERVTGTELGSLRPGAVVVDLSTIDPATAVAAAESLAKADVAYLDSPVLGRPDKCGSWTLAMGGPAEFVASVRPLLESSIARLVVHTGAAGTGSTVKLLNNLMFGAINATTAEVLNTCQAAGVDPHVFVETLVESRSAAMSNLFTELAPKILAGDYSPTFGLGLLRKDNRLALQLAERLDCASFMASAVAQVNNLANSCGYGAEDTGSVYKLYARLRPNAHSDQQADPPAD